MTDDVRPEVIKKTQDLLGKYFKKPPLTEKLLKKPPFRFLHDIISAVIRETGFLEGLFTEEELHSENIKDKEGKLAYLTKLIDVVKLISGSNLTVRASKIISGQEPTKTNELLQAIGKALDKKVSSVEAIEHYKKNLEKKTKSKTKPTSKDEAKKSTRQPSQTRKTEKEKSTVEQKRRSSTSGKIVNNDAENEKPNRHHTEKEINENGTPNKNTEIIDTSPAEPVQERAPSSQKRKNSSSGKIKQNALPSASSSESRKINSLARSSSSDKKLEEHVRRRNSASKVKESSQVIENIAEKEVLDISDALTHTTNLQKDKIDINRDGYEITKNVSPSNEPLQQSVNNHPPSEYTNALSDINEPSTSQQNVSRPRTSLRPPSARPISGRPAAPRMRAKPELIVNEEIVTPVGSINVIIENSDGKDDDDAEDMVVMETRGSSDSLDNTSYKMDSQLTQEHGHLVAQILETQKELVNNDNVDVLPKKVDIEWDIGSKRDREVVIKEVDKLRSTIQTLTRATNPLGKLFDYLQEDVEMMQKELLDWQNQYSQLNKELEREQMQTQEVIEPMKETLKEIDINMKIQLDKICQAKSQIMKNDQKIQRLLNGHV
ncbi:hypothetical protein KM043_010106 [Ampulex compressa]|nr:hypothetical protein KM043_010106 [Ampulex compressa]